jgi:small subunit ribosomal protein S17
MAEKTPIKKAAATKAPAEKKTERETASPARAKSASPERVSSAKAERSSRTAKSTAAAKAAAAPRTAGAKATAAAVTARKAVTVRKRTAATVAHTATPAGEQATGWRRFRRKTKVGVVISAKQPKTVIVTVGRMRKHPLYKKVINLRKGFAAHDEAGDVREGDLVRIQESRPYSATKRWLVVEVLSRTGEAGAAAPRPEDIEKQLEQAEGVSELLSVGAKADEGEEAEK